MKGLFPPQTLPIVLANGKQRTFSLFFIIYTEDILFIFYYLFYLCMNFRFFFHVPEPFEHLCHAEKNNGATGPHPLSKHLRGGGRKANK